MCCVVCFFCCWIFKWLLFWLYGLCCVGMEVVWYGVLVVCGMDCVGGV